MVMMMILPLMHFVGMESAALRREADRGRHNLRSIRGEGEWTEN